MDTWSIFTHKMLQLLHIISSRVFLSDPVVSMENLHSLTRCLGHPSPRRAEFHETYHNLLTCLSCPPLPRCFFFLKELCGALAHRLMYSFSYFFIFLGLVDMSFT